MNKPITTKHLLITIVLVATVWIMHWAYTSWRDAVRESAVDVPMGFSLEQERRFKWFCETQYKGYAYEGSGYCTYLGKEGNTVWNVDKLSPNPALCEEVR